MTTIDTLQIQIESDSTHAAQGISTLAKSLGELKSNGTVNVAIKNLNNLRDSLRSFTNVPSSASKLFALASSMERLKSVGSVGSIGNSLGKLANSLKELDKVNIGSVGPQIQKIAEAAAPLSSLKAGGLSSMVNALAKIGKVTQGLDDDKIAAFAERVQRLNDVLEPLSGKMTTIQAGLRGLNSSARSAGSSVRQMGEDLDTASINMSSFIYIVQEAVQWIQAAIEKFSQFMGQAIEWDGIAARFGRGFGPQAQETYEWIQRLNEEMDINVQQFMQYSSLYAQMLTGFGVAHKDVADMALGYTELTYDIWAAANDRYKTFEEAAEAVASAISGEVEPIRRAGFTIIESTLQQTAANHGLDISLEKATEAQKSYLRYLTLVDQAHSTGVIGTYARELNTAEGMVRTFSQQLKSLAQAFGSLFLPILVKVLPYLQAFVKLLTEAVHWVAGVFGIEIQAVNFSDYGKGAEAGAEAIDKVAGSAAGAGDALGTAAEAAKELKNAMIGIDELNVISPPSASGGSGGSGGGAGGAGGGSGGFDNLDIDSLWDESIFDGIQNQVDEIKAKFEAWLPVLGTIAGALGALGVTSLITSMGNALAEMNKLQKAAAGIAILTIEAALVFAFTDNYLESGNLLNLVGEALVTAASGYLMFKAWGPAGATLALGVSVLAQLLAIKMSLADGTVSLSSPELWIQGIATTLMGAFGGALLTKNTGFFAKEGFMIGLGVTAALTLTAIRIGAIESGEIQSDSVEAWIMEIGSVLSAGLAGKWLGSALYTKGGPMGALIGVTAGLVLNLVGTISVKGEDFGNEISDWINVAITGAMAAFTGAKLWKMVSPAIGPALTAIIPKIGAALTTALGGLSSVIAAAGGGWVVAAVAAIAGLIVLAFVDYDFTEIGRTIGEKIGKAFKAVGGWFKDVGTAIKDGLKSALDWVKESFEIDSVFDVINLLFNPYTWITKIVPKMIEIGREVLPGLWQGVTDKLENLWGNITEFVSGFIQGFKDGLGIKSPSTVFAEIGDFLVQGLWQGIKDKATWLYDKVSDWVDEIVGKVKGFFGIKSPSKVFTEIGEYLTDGLVKGMKDLSALTDPLKEMWQKAKDWAKDTDFSLSITPSVGSIESKLKDRWSSAKKWWNEKKGGLKEYTPGIGSIYEKMKSRWDSARTWWNSKKTKAKDYTPNIGSIYDKLSVRWKNARDWWNKKKGSMSYTPSIGSLTDKLRNSWNSAKKWWNKNVKLNTKLNVQVPTIKVKWDTASAFGKSFKYPTGFSLKFAAAGGIFDAGSLIWAGERGAEIVANAGGGRTGVMNVQQMSDAVFEGVYAAVMAANRASRGEGGDLAVNVYLDGRQITAAVEKRQRERGANIMGNQVYTHG